jgi:hypothetical protein
MPENSEVLGPIRGGEDVREVRNTLGLTVRGLASVLRLGPNGERRIRRIEKGELDVTGPMEVAMEALADGWWPEGYASDGWPEGSDAD